MKPGLIIVSNRLPISVKKVDGKLEFFPSIGGLATGLASYATNKKNKWIGWPGIASDKLTTAEKETITDELAKQGYIPVFLTQKQLDNYYNGFSNSVLWPIFHDLPLRARRSKIDEWWQAYESVNKRFAEVTLHTATPKSQVWVHDYQLLLVPGLLKQEASDTNVGFFLHIPFPNSKRFTNLSQARKILRGMLAADLVGFHTTNYVQSFIRSVQANNLGTLEKDSIVIGEHSTKIAEFPMGIDYDKYSEASKLKGVRQAVKKYKRRYRRMRVIVSVDRLDPSKGLINRLNAYSQFLDLHPEWHNKLTFVMVAAPSRTDIAAYKELSEELLALAKKINKRYGSRKWLPLDYINEPLGFEDVTALFQIADIGLIAPYRDGMNLAAKEFVASSKRRGVLILSQTAGAAEELSDALIVDPEKPESLVEALDEALHMRRRELRSRLRNMKQNISTNTVQSWAKTFIDSLQQPIPGTPRITRSLTKRLEKSLLGEYRQATARLLLLDYDGSLVPFSEDFTEAKPPEQLINLLNKLADDKSNEVVIISGRSAEELDNWFGKLSISLVAEHGAALRRTNGKWQTIEKTDTTWKQLLLPTLEKYAALAPGAKVEIKPHSLVWHYRAASDYSAQKYAVIIKRSLKPILKKRGLELVQGNKILEIKNPRISKGAIAERWISQKHDFILSVGDDVTDEDLFNQLPPEANSIKVGRGLTQARYRLASYRQVLSLLRRLSA